MDFARKFVTLLMALAFLASLSLGCAPAVEPTPVAEPTPIDTPPDDVIEIHVLHQYTEGAGAQPVLVQLTQEYEAEHPNIEVNWIWAGWEMFDARLMAMIEAGNPLDAVWQAEAKHTAYAREGLTVPADEFLAEPNYEGDSTWLDSFYPSLMELAYVEDAAAGPGHYAIPNGMYTSGIFYNVNIFAEHGVAPPETWSELMDVCEKLESLGITPFAHDGVGGRIL